MRIISSFRDYYDCIQAHGQDRQLVYVRERKKLDQQPFLGYINGNYLGRNNYFDVNTRLENYIIGFCGKLYPLFKIWFDNKPYFCFSLAEVDQFVEQNFNKKQQKLFHSKKWRPQPSYYWQRTNMVRYFHDFNLKANTYFSFFEEHYCPAFVANVIDKKVILNEMLKDYDFMRIFDPYMCFQEISMFLGSLAVPGKTIPEISDKDMVEIKGFDPKWSFRKESQ